MKWLLWKDYRHNRLIIVRGVGAAARALSDRRCCNVHRILHLCDDQRSRVASSAAALVRSHHGGGHLQPDDFSVQHGATRRNAIWASALIGRRNSCTHCPLPADRCSRANSCLL